MPVLALVDQQRWSLIGWTLGFAALAYFLVSLARTIVDSMLAIPSMRVYFDRLGVAVAQAHRLEQNLAVLFLDLDDFKAVNDTYGHAAGDAVLKDVTKGTLAQLRAEDVVARYGGDEFVVRLRGTDVHGAVRLAERVRATVDVMPAGVAGKVIPVSVSAGCASLGETEGDGATELIARADERMRVDVARAQRVAAGVLDQHRLSGLEAGERGGARVHLVAENPDVAGAQAAFFVFLENQGGEFHRACPAGNKGGRHYRRKRPLPTPDLGNAGEVDYS